MTHYTDKRWTTEGRSMTERYRMTLGREEADEIARLQRAIRDAIADLEKGHGVVNGLTILRLALRPAEPDHDGSTDRG